MVQLRDFAAARLKTYDRQCERTLVAPGAEVAWDECCDGFLYVRLVQLFPTGNPFPQLDVRPGNCKPILQGAALAVGVLRCASGGPGQTPEAETLTAEALGITADASILLETIQCDLAPLATDSTSQVEAIMLGVWTPLGPDGQCSGGEWTVTIATGTCGCGEG